MANLGCGGEESSLFDCSYDGPGSHSCSHGDDVGIVCEEKPASPGLGLGAIIGIVVGVIILLTVPFIILCCVVCNSKPSRVTTTGVSTGGPTVVHTNMMYPTSGIVVGGAYPMQIQQSALYQQPMQPQQPYQQPMQPQQPPAYQQPTQQPPGYPQPNQSMQPQQQPSQIPPPPAYEEPAKPSEGQLYSQ
ncbi:protein shisa-5-like [Branchiostoma lanceolatum]|uniref:protein shisa-5-like n=1 Tax=Branchiostoma lanceolatum TaxID=7740 RepID=UPI00345450FC